LSENKKNGVAKTAKLKERYKKRRGRPGAGCQHLPEKERRMPNAAERTSDQTFSGGGKGVEQQGKEKSLDGKLNATSRHPSTVEEKYDDVGWQAWRAQMAPTGTKRKLAGSRVFY